MQWTGIGVISASYVSQGWNILVLFLVLGVCCEALHALLRRSTTPCIDECNKRESALRLNNRVIKDPPQIVHGSSIHGDLIDSIVRLLLKDEGLVSLFLIPQVSKNWSRQYALCIEAAAARQLCLCPSDPLSESLPSRMLHALLVHSMRPDKTSYRLEGLSRLDEDWLDWAPEEWGDEIEAGEEALMAASEHLGDAPEMVFLVLSVHLCVKGSPGPGKALVEDEGCEPRRAGALIATHVTSYRSYRCDALHDEQAAMHIKHNWPSPAGLQRGFAQTVIPGGYELQSQLAVLRSDGSIVQCLHPGLQHRRVPDLAVPGREMYQVLHPSCLPGPASDDSEGELEEEQEGGDGDPPVCHVAHSMAWHGHELHLVSTALSCVHPKDPEKTFTMYDLLCVIELLQWHGVRSGLQRKEYELYGESLRRTS